MQKVLTAAEMRDVDRLTTEKYGIPSLLLMENAAQAVARAICQKLGGSVEDSSILILCGKGNNGGDGAALARILWEQGANVEVVLIGLASATKGDARTNFEILQKISDHEGFELAASDLSFEEIASIEEWMEYDSVNFQTDDPDVIVDALFGTGLNKPLDGVYAQVAAFIYAYNGECEGGGPFIVSIDLPSGLCADKAEVDGIAPCADMTVTFTAPKTANVLPPASNFCGELHVASIGSPWELVENSPSQLYVAEKRDAAVWLDATEFRFDSYKNKRGHALLIAGSANYSGAAVLCGNAAIRTGVGLVTIATAKSSRDSIAARIMAEVMVRGLAETDAGAIAKEAVSELEEVLEKIDVIAIGSGLSSSDESTRGFVREIVANRKIPVIIDADGLNCLSGDELVGSAELPVIITPHEGEFLRLLGTDDKSVLDGRVEAVRQFAIAHNVILVLKGVRALIAAPDGRVVINPTGNSGLGKAGNGDTLTGIIAGFVAQAAQIGTDMFETVVAAVYLAGLAGDLAEEKYGKRAMTASDVRDCLVEAFASVAE